jgi:hypothetical protein
MARSSQRVALDLHIEEMMSMSKPRSDKKLSADEIHALVMKPFPTVNILPSKGNSQAPRWVKRVQDRKQERESNYELDK